MMLFGLFTSLSLFSGLKVNNSKSSSTFSKFYEEDQSLHNIQGFTVKSLPII